MSIFPALKFRRPEIRQANMYFAVATLVLVIGVTFGYGKVSAFIDQKQSIVEHAELITLLEEEARASTAVSDEIVATYGKELESFRSVIAKVLPGSESYTELTKQLDLFFDEHSEVKKNPIIAGSLRFGKGMKLKDSPFSVLPSSLTVESSKENFFTFLNYLETSGSLETGTRLMEVQSVQMNFSTNSAGAEHISFTVDLRAYYRNNDGSIDKS